MGVEGEAHFHRGDGPSGAHKRSAFAGCHPFGGTAVPPNPRRVVPISLADGCKYFGRAPLETTFQCLGDPLGMHHRTADEGEGLVRVAIIHTAGTNLPVEFEDQFHLTVGP